MNAPATHVNKEAHALTEKMVTPAFVSVGMRVILVEQVSDI